MFTVTQVGSWPRSPDAAAGPARPPEGAASPAQDFERVADEEVRRMRPLQVEAGVELVVDGEHRRDNFYSFVTEKVDGTRLMSLAEMLDTVEDKSGFEEMLDDPRRPGLGDPQPDLRRPPLAPRAAGGRRAALRPAADRPAGQGHPARPVPAHPLDVGRGLFRAGLRGTRRRWARTWCGSCARSCSTCARPARLRPVRRAGADRDRPLGGDEPPHLHVSDAGHPP